MLSKTRLNLDQTQQHDEQSHVHDHDDQQQQPHTPHPHDSHDSPINIIPQVLLGNGRLAGKIQDVPIYIY